MDELSIQIKKLIIRLEWHLLPPLPLGEGWGEGKV
jgi:hypothetical protein